MTLSSSSPACGGGRGGGLSTHSTRGEPLPDRFAVRPPPQTGEVKKGNPMNNPERQSALARNVRRLGHLDLPGAGQVTVAGRYAYVGHLPSKSHLGTSIIDIAAPGNPRVVATVTLDDQTSHSHKVRVAGDIMIVNHERNPTAIGRRADELPQVNRKLTQALGRAGTPTDA